MIIKEAQTSAEIVEVRRLFREYEAFLNEDLCFQDFEAELAHLPGQYAYPTGSLLIAIYKEKIIGCVGVRKLEHTICEMKRLFVRPEARGLGFGRRLAQESISAARTLGYTLMRLDTLDRLIEALHLYETLGFQKTKPYYGNPLSGVVYLELWLNDESLSH